jgi:hypothetical protein
MSSLITKKNATDTYKYFYPEISSLGIPDPNPRAAVIKDNYMFLYYGKIPRVTDGVISKLAKINLNTNEVETVVFTYNAAGSSVQYSVPLGILNVDMPASNRAILWNGNTLVTLIRTMQPFDGVTLVKLDLSSNTITLRALTGMASDSYILDLTIDGNNLYVISKAGSIEESYNKVHKIDLNSNTADGCATSGYTINSLLRGNNAIHFHNGLLYMFGGRYYDSIESIVLDASSKYFSINVLDLSDPDCINTHNIISQIAIPVTINNIPVIFNGVQVHIPYNPNVFTFNLEDGSLYKNASTEIMYGNISALNGTEIIFLDFTSGTIIRSAEPSSIHLVAYGTIQFYDGVESNSSTKKTYYTRSINKITDKEYITKFILNDTGGI